MTEPGPSAPLPARASDPWAERLEREMTALWNEQTAVLWWRRRVAQRAQSAQNRESDGDES